MRVSTNVARERCAATRVEGCIRWEIQECKVRLGANIEIKLTRCQLSLSHHWRASYGFDGVGKRACASNRQWGQVNRLDLNTLVPALKSHVIPRSVSPTSCSNYSMSMPSRI